MRQGICSPTTFVGTIQSILTDKVYYEYLKYQLLKQHVFFYIEIKEVLIWIEKLELKKTTVFKLDWLFHLFQRTTTKKKVDS